MYLFRKDLNMRGSKKDFVDLYFLLENYSLNDLLHYTQVKYAQTDYNQTDILKSLVYFKDAEDQPMPWMRKPLLWAEVQEKINAAVKSVNLT